MDAPSDTDRGKFQVDTRYLAVVALLMVVIVACLAVLWLGERGRRIAAEVRAAELMRENVNLQTVVQRMMLLRSGEPAGLPSHLVPATQPATAPASSENHGP